VVLVIELAVERVVMMVLAMIVAVVVGMVIVRPRVGNVRNNHAVGGRVVAERGEDRRLVLQQRSVSRTRQQVCTARRIAVSSAQESTSNGRMSRRAADGPSLAKRMRFASEMIGSSSMAGAGGCATRARSQ
jgi:hypothetical protein